MKRSEVGKQRRKCLPCYKRVFSPILRKRKLCVGSVRSLTEAGKLIPAEDEITYNLCCVSGVPSLHFDIAKAFCSGLVLECALFGSVRDLEAAIL